LQRRLGLGYTRAARLVDMMEEDGIVGPAKGSKPREVLIDLETLSDRQKGHEKSEQTKD
jgi:DNA segregation ATPase FtsK/SpoIIIE, S-DNA-T family